MIHCTKNKAITINKLYSKLKIKYFEVPNPPYAIRYITFEKRANAHCTHLHIAPADPPTKYAKVCNLACPL
jgi:hypothetical protein